MIAYYKFASLFVLWICLCIFPNVLHAEMITTTFAANNGQAGNMFDVDILAPNGITMEEIELNLFAGSWNVNIYTRDGSYAGNETNPGAWTLHDSITGLNSLGANGPTSWDILDLNLTTGPQAFYVQVTNGAALRYTNGTSEGAVFVADANIQIREGTGNAGNFGFQFRPRVWNGTIVYSVNPPVPEPTAALLAFLGVVLTAVRRRRVDV